MTRMVTLFDVLIATFELRQGDVLERFPEAAQDPLRAGAWWPERN